MASKITFALFIAILSVVCAAPAEPDLSFDDLKPSTDDESVQVFGDEAGVDLVMAKVISRENESKAITEIVIFPWEGMKYPNFIVHGVKHKDFTPDQTTSVEIIGGGINKHYIKLRVKSKAGKDIRSSLRFYAKKINESNVPLYSTEYADEPSFFARIVNWCTTCFEKLISVFKSSPSKSE